MSKWASLCRGAAEPTGQNTPELSDGHGMGALDPAGQNCDCKHSDPCQAPGLGQKKPAMQASGAERPAVGQNELKKMTKL